MARGANKSGGNYESLVAAIKSGQVGNFYIFHGEERYLLERCLSGLRTLLCPDGLDGFNYKRYEGKTLAFDELEDAINTFPAFADKTLVEIHDFDIFKGDQRIKLSGIFSELPDYVCLVFVYSTIEYKPDGRQKINKEILKYASVVEFAVQEQDKLTRWIKRHFTDAGKSISTEDAEYLAFITGGLMATLHGEIEKTAAYAKSDYVGRKDIDAVVTPILDAVAYKLTDAIINREHKRAVLLLDELFRMREAPHKLMYSISLKMRHLLAARICIDNKSGKADLMDMCGIRHEFQAGAVMSTARKATLADCRDAVLYCSETAFELNSSPEPESRLTELVAKLALSR
jgi:DNA polymerase-3 subunit delta